MAKIERFREVFLWREKAPFSGGSGGARTERFLPANDGIDRLTDVTEPSFTFFPASGRKPHPAVVVAPGGGYQFLSWNHEGIDVCSFFNSIGFSAFLLKYRVPGNRKGAHADAARAIRLIRHRATEFGIDPARLGMLGFSAGAHLAATVAAPARKSPYPARDAADKENARPDFCALVYPAYLCGADLALAAEFRIDADTPPVFLVQSENDPVGIENALGWFLAMKKADRPAELHCFAEGGHGYGLFRTGHPVADWPLLAARWFREAAKVR